MIDVDPRLCGDLHIDYATVRTYRCRACGTESTAAFMKMTPVAQVLCADCGSKSLPLKQASAEIETLITYAHREGAT